MSGKRGLGRGLGALLGDGDAPARTTRGRDVAPAGAEPPRADAEVASDGMRTRETGLREIPVDRIRPNPSQPRNRFDPQAMAELEQSIRELGVLVPIVVRLSERSAATPQYQIIAGERRWRAACAARLATVPAVVRFADDRTSLEIAIVENLQREDLGALEEAMGFAHLLDEYGFTQERLAERLGKSRPAIANALRLLGLPDAVKTHVRDGRLSAGQARAVLAFPADRRLAIAERAARDGLTVRELERLAARPEPVARRVRPLSPDIERVVTTLRYKLGTNVAIHNGRRGGKIEIRYHDAGELTRLIDVLLPAEE